MKLIIKDRASGRTTGLIHTSEATGYPIVCQSKMNTNYVKESAEKIGARIPNPISVDELLSVPDNKKPKHVLIDDVNIRILKDAVQSYLGCDVVACTCFPDYTDEEFNAVFEDCRHPKFRKAVVVSC